MTTLAANSPRDFEVGERNDVPMIASDIIYEGAAVGVVDGTGHARPLNAADRFAGFSTDKVDNSAGSAADLNVNVIKQGQAVLSVSGAVITDVGQPVYATDDDTFVFSPVGGVFIGNVKRYVSAGVAVVAFDAGVMADPWAHLTVRELLSATKTFDIQDSGKLFCVDAAGDGDALTLPAIADGLSGITIMAIGAFGTTALTIDPDAGDSIAGPDMTAVANKDLVCTKATQRRGDFVSLDNGDADGYVTYALRGTWVKEG
jgi:hypothetical protein